MYILTIDDDSYGYQKKKKLLSLCPKKKNPVFQPVKKKYPGFPAEEKKRRSHQKYPPPPRNSNGPSLTDKIGQDAGLQVH